MSEIIKIACDLRMVDTLAVEPRADNKVVLRVGGTRYDAGKIIRLTPKTAQVLVDAVTRMAGLAKPVQAPASPKPSVTFGTGVGAIKKIDQGDVEAARDALFVAFSWCDSPEGGDFWRAIHDRLADIAAELAKPVAPPPPRYTAVDFQTVTPPGYDTVAGYLFRKGGAEKALHDDATKAGVALRKASKAQELPEVRVKAPAAVTAANRHIKRVLAYPEAVLAAHFGPVAASKTPLKPTFAVGGRAIIDRPQSAGFERGAAVVLTRANDCRATGCRGWDITSVRTGAKTWVYETSLKAA